MACRFPATKFDRPTGLGLPRSRFNPVGPRAEDRSGRVWFARQSSIGTRFPVCRIALLAGPATVRTLAELPFRSPVARASSARLFQGIGVAVRASETPGSQPDRCVERKLRWIVVALRVNGEASDGGLERCSGKPAGGAVLDRRENTMCSAATAIIDRSQTR